MNALDPLSGQSAQNLMTQLDARRLELAYWNHSLPGLVIGSGSTAKVKIANTITFSTGGAVVSQNAATGLLTFTTAGTTPPRPAVGQGLSKTTAEIAFAVGAASNIATGFDQYFWVCLDAAGNGYLVPGAPAALGKALLPAVPSDFTGTVITGNAGQTVIGQTPGTAANQAVGYNSSTLSNGTVVQGGIPQRIVTIIGHILVSNASGSAFTAGTTALNASGITTTYTDVLGDPGALFMQIQ